MVSVGYSWEHVRTYTSSGSDSTTLTMTQPTKFYAVAKAPTIGTSLSLFKQGTTPRISASARDGAVTCDEDEIDPSNPGTVKFITEATVHSGTAICYGFDQSSQYYGVKFCEDGQPQ